MRIVLLGGEGQLGRAIARVLAGHDLTIPSHAQLDIGDERAVREALASWRPDAVVNTAAFHDVPRCEAEGEQAFRVNALGPRALARGSAAVGAPLLHISTDYVFDGRAGRPYREDDVAAPLNLYGETKLVGERQMLAHQPQAWILRTTGLYGPDPCRAKPGGRNFVELMLHLAQTRDEVQVVDDVRCCPTYVDDLAQQVRTLLEQQAPFGLYHAVNPEGDSWYTFARALFAARGVRTRLVPVDHRTFADPVPRPLDSRLSVDKLRALGLLELRPQAEALAAYLKVRG